MIKLERETIDHNILVLSNEIRKLNKRVKELENNQIYQMIEDIKKENLEERKKKQRKLK